MGSVKSIKDISVAGKRVLVRCDFNVPLNENGHVKNDFKIQQTLPTIKYLIESGAKIILMSHLGKPEGKFDPKLKLDPIAHRLSELLRRPIFKADDCIGPEVDGKSRTLDTGEILLLENVRFYKEELSCDTEFAKKLSYLGDVYVNDAFGVCHRNQASVTGVPTFLEHSAGLLLQREINDLDKIIKNPERPFVVLVGGKKVETKTQFINKISKIADVVLISGLIKKELADKGISLDHPEKVIGPEEDLDSLDINEKTVQIFKDQILKAKTILWNGPFGKFEDKKYGVGTLAIAKAIIKSEAFSVAGGGQTVEFLAESGIILKFGHISTGGGAMLGYLSGGSLPGINVLQSK